MKYSFSTLHYLIYLPPLQVYSMAIINVLNADCFCLDEESNVIIVFGKINR